MKNYLNIKNLIIKIEQYIFILFTATIFLLINCSKSFSIENVFVIDQVQVEGKIDINFSREKFIDKAFIKSFEILKNKILLSKDLNKIKNINLTELKKLINSFQILNETYKKDKYKGEFKIFYDEEKIKKYIGRKNISFSQPTNISIVFFPILFANEEMVDLEENYFYKNWNEADINNKTINFILPLEDLDDILKIKNMQNANKELNLNELIYKYDVQNYALALMDFNSQDLKIYLKTKFNNNIVSKNINYPLSDLNNISQMKNILVNLKLEILDIWKQENIINIAMPLTIKIQFYHQKLKDFQNLKQSLSEINLIKNYSVEKFDVNKSFFQIYYYGNPKKLKIELLKFGYQLNDDQGYWELKKND